MRHLFLACLLVFLGSITSAQARQSSQLWAERSSKSPPLAQVPDFRTLAKQLIPTVVSIQVEQRVKASASPNPQMPQDPLEFFHRFFGGEVPREFNNRGLGSGFIISNSGLILTNYHVVENADAIEVTLNEPDGSEQKVAAKVLGTAPDYDVALLQANQAIHNAPAYLGDSDSTQIGDWVMAVGNPFGLSHSVSVGIISAKERREVVPSGRQGLYNFLQTDASINPGNSGGPLVNMRGEVIGINSAVNASGGIGFAIPINMVKDMLSDLKDKGHYARSWLGLKIQALTPELAQSYNLKRTNGALVAEVMPNGPAAAANIREGDVILSFDNKELRQSSDLPLFASMAGVGKRVPLKIHRNGKDIVVSVLLAEFPTDAVQSANNMPATDAGKLGMFTGDLTPHLQQQLGLEDPRGAVVKQLADNGPAARAGLRPGDVIRSINGLDIINNQKLIEVLDQQPPQSMLRVKVIRGGAGLFIAIQKP